MITRREVLKSGVLGLAGAALPDVSLGQEAAANEQHRDDFRLPPEGARPWVYWYFMDGNLTREGMTADLEALKAAGIGGAIYLEVGIGVERGTIEFMSEPWQELLGHAFREAERLRLEMALTTGPGWCGSGGPWIKPEQSMQHLVSSETVVCGPMVFDEVLPQPKPRTPFFGEDTLSPELHKLWKEFYADVVVLAFPRPQAGLRVAEIDEKALYTRGSYSSQIPGPYSSLPSVRPYFLQAAEDTTFSAPQCIASGSILDLTAQMTRDGRLAWKVPAGDWTILRFGRTITGQTTRPAPAPGLGLESDKFDQAATDQHFEAFIGYLLKKTGEPSRRGFGLTTLHFDSWEMSSQNWSSRFQQEFLARRGYDPAGFLPTFSGYVVSSPAVTERFLWDVRQTAQELVIERHVRRLRDLGQRHGLQLSLEPYDLNPCADLSLGTVADVPMGEFWSKGWDVKTDFSIIEATSLGHTLGKPIIGAEAFTAQMEEHGRQHPASMKVQGDWAFCAGINRFVFHRYQAQPWLDRFPGMMMGPKGGYGVQWQRTQTWWSMATAYHLYLSRCQHMLRRGLFVADVLYLALEGAPNVFLPPRSATRGGEMRDRRGYNFDGCAPETLIARASVHAGRVVFPDGMSYSLLVLPRSETMTPQLLAKILELAEHGASVVGAPPRRSPSLTDHPRCDGQVKALATRLWGGPGHKQAIRTVGKGRVILDAAAGAAGANPLAMAQWIWIQRGANRLTDAQAERLYFRRSVPVQQDRPLRSAQVTICASGSYEVFVNGRSFGKGEHATIATLDISAGLKSGENSVSVIVDERNGSSQQGGLAAAVRLDGEDGKTTILYTDRHWEVSRSAAGTYLRAVERGAPGASPWDMDESAFEPYELYPTYAMTAAILADRGIVPDFEGGGASSVYSPARCR